MRNATNKLLFVALTFGLYLFGGVSFVNASSVSLSGGDISYTGSATSFCVVFWDTDASVWSYGGFTPSGNGDVTISGTNFTLQNLWGRTDQNVAVFVRTPSTACSSYYLTPTLADAAADSATLDYFYAEMDGAGDYTCVSELGNYTSCDTPTPPGPSTSTASTSDYTSQMNFIVLLFLASYFLLVTYAVKRQLVNFL